MLDLYIFMIDIIGKIINNIRNIEEYLFQI